MSVHHTLCWQCIMIHHTMARLSICISRSWRVGCTVFVLVGGIPVVWSVGCTVIMLVGGIPNIWSVGCTVIVLVSVTDDGLLHIKKTTRAIAPVVMRRSKCTFYRISAFIQLNLKSRRNTLSKLRIHLVPVPDLSMLNFFLFHRLHRSDDIFNQSCSLLLR
jgi:hypothetical protein